MRRRRLHDGTYTYDAANRLTGTTDGTTASGFAYRGNGLSRDSRGVISCDSHLVSKTVNGVTTYYVLDLAGGLTQVRVETTGSQTATYL
jgi:YD repeat-containing protein